MDLDLLKQEWQNRELFKQEIKESVIKEMITNRNKGAFARIKKNEKDALRVIPISVISFLCCSIPLIMQGGFGMVWALLMIPIGALLWYWSYWLCGFLDKIDMGRMNVTEVSRYILKYKIYLIRHTVIVAFLMPVYLGVWCYLYFTSSHISDPDIFTVEMLVIYLACALVLFFVIIWHRFFKHIRDIQNNLRELAEFEQEDR